MPTYRAIIASIEGGDLGYDNEQDLHSALVALADDPDAWGVGVFGPYEAQDDEWAAIYARARFFDGGWLPDDTVFFVWRVP